jgi:poly(glycerol-phosphate) alpha-glucosyltransferase
VGWDDGGHQTELEHQVKENGLTAHIRFLGELYGDEKEQALRNASAFILPSHGEGHPISALEAWSYSLPILMTAGCNLPEGFELGAASEIHLDGRFSGELATWLQLPPTTLRKMGERGREIVEQRYDWAALTADFADLYHWVAGYGERPACVRLD